MSVTDDLIWMNHALGLARHAAAQNEVPVGAVVVRDAMVLGEGWNQPIATHDPTAHAEVVAIRDASHRAGNYRLPGTTLYVTLEPCAMCFGAMVHARIERLVFGAADPKSGAVYSVIKLPEIGEFNHVITCVEGVLASECGALLTQFFKVRRGMKAGKS